MSKTLNELGFKLVHDYRDKGHEYPSIMFERVMMSGYHVERLIFDTIHGGPWTFEMGLSVFLPNRELDWTTQERVEFNPASRDFIGCNVGHWATERPVMDAELCRAVADYITVLERERVLDEYAEKFHNAKMMLEAFDYDALRREYAAKLRLAGDGDE